jgi:chromosome segregation ATPase|eukprot:SAG25_NODE_949_length_4609_cov_5.731264_7_plen_134_part_00
MAQVVDVVGLTQGFDEMVQRLEQLEKLREADERTISRLTSQAAELERKAAAERELRVSLAERVDHAFAAVEALGEEEVSMARAEADIETAEQKTEAQLQVLVDTLTMAVDRGSDSQARIDALVRGKATKPAAT